MKTKILIAFILLAWYTVFGASPSFQQVTNAHTAMLTNGATPGALLTFTNNADWTRNMKWTGSQLELTTTGGPTNVIVGTNGSVTLAGGGSGTLGLRVNGNTLLVTNDNVGVGGDPVAGYKLAVGGSIRASGQVLAGTYNQGRYLLFSVGGSGYLQGDNDRIYNTTSGTFMLTDGTGTNLSSVLAKNGTYSGLVTATNGSRFEGDSIWAVTGGPTNVVIGTNGAINASGNITGGGLYAGASLYMTGSGITIPTAGYIRDSATRIFVTPTGTPTLILGNQFTNIITPSSLTLTNGNLTVSGLVTATNGVFGSFGTMALTTNMAVVINTTTQAFTGFNYVVSTGSIANNGTGFTNAIAGYYRIRVGASYLSSDAANTIGKVYTNGVICNLVSFHRGFTAATTVYGNANSENTVYLPANCYTQFAIGSDANETLTFAHADFSMSPAN